MPANVVFFFIGIALCTFGSIAAIQSIDLKFKGNSKAKKLANIALGLLFVGALMISFMERLADLMTYF